MATAKKAGAKSAPAKKTRVAVAAESKPRTRRVWLGDAEKDEDEGQQASSYFADVSAKSGLRFVSSGASIMDAALGGGWVLGRVVNLVGDRSAGKTLLAIEACVNFHHRYPEGHIRYAESEAAFDEKYAEALGLPVHAVDFDPDKPLKTIEDWYKDILEVMEKNKGKPILYVLDSLDALSDEAEAKREIDDGTYGGNKAKKLGEMFRRVVQQMEQQEVLLVVVSQLRDKINAMAFGEKQTRSGGRALDFYASHIVWLAEIGKLKQTIGGVERVIGVKVKARVRKNKVGLPHRECEYPILFGYGVDDITAGVEWLIAVKCEHRLEELDMSKSGYKLRITNLRNKGGQPIREIRAKLNAIIAEEWQRIETSFLPKSGKY